MSTTLINILQQCHSLTKNDFILLNQKITATQQPLIDYAINVLGINEKSLAKSCAEILNLSYQELNNHDIDNMQFIYLNIELQTLWQSHHILPLQIDELQLTVAIADPDELRFIEEMHIKNKFTEIRILIVPYTQLLHALNQIRTKYYYQNEHNIIILVENILTDALYRHASDIHVEPQSQHIMIRMRIDGLLHTITVLPNNLANALASRLKIMANLDIAEKRLPQDGRFHFTAKPWLIRDIRMSSCPTLYGEKIVLRILDAEKNQLTINGLGLENHQAELFLKALAKPQGLIIVTGPTGSGKTITLYSALQKLNTAEKNIMTIEDPVEISISEINQVNVNIKTGLNFSVALRTFLRQDPDIIMVGEIRDKETAEMAIRAGQTGHLVLTTMHTNSAVESLQRLIYMGIAPYNLANTISMIIAQRLLRRICVECCGKACASCYNGYRGRTGVFEIMVMTPNITESLLLKRSMHKIREIAMQEGMLTLWQAGLNKVQQGISNIQECYRVINEDQM